MTRRLSKRGLESVLFNEETGKLQDEVINVCKFCGVEISALYPK